MLFIIISVIEIIGILLLANDVMFNKRRNKYLKVLELIVLFGLLYYLFMSSTSFIIKKNNTEKQIKEQLNNIGKFDSTMVEYDLNGNPIKTTTIGEYLYNHFVYDVFDAHTNISNSEYLKNNIIVIVVASIYFVYWILLLLLFEKEEVSGYKIVEDEKLFEKYNPLIAACIAQNRNIMCRDVVAVILNLIDKKKINLRIVPDETSKDIGYRYMISENKESNIRIDMIESYIFDWIFEEVKNYEKGIINCNYISKSEEGEIEIDFVKRLTEISKSEDSYGILKELNYNVNKRLNNIGANKESVPFGLKAFNNLLILISIILVANHILKNGMDLSITNLEVIYVMFIMIFAITILPLIYILSLVCIEFIRTIFRVLGQVTEGYSGRRLIAKAVSIILATLILIVIYAIFAKDYYIIYDILLLGITCLIIFTDDYMLKHDPEILNDFYNLRRIEKKLNDYSLMKEENIEYSKLWEHYYSYAVAFGIPNPVNEEIGTIYDKAQIITKPNLESVFYVCKSYLEVMWDMEFFETKSKIDLAKYIKF